MPLWQLALVYLVLTLVSVGGPGAILSTAHAAFVDRFGALTAAQFSGVYGLASAAPGPNIIFFVGLAYVIDGWPGVAIALLFFVLPLGAAAGLVGWAGERARRPGPLRLRRALNPVVLGLGAYGAVVAGAPLPLPVLGLAAVAVVVLLTTKLNPAFVVLACAVIGAIAFGW